MRIYVYICSAYQRLNHVDSVLPHFPATSINVNNSFSFRLFEKVVDGDEGSGAPDASAGQKIGNF